MTDTLLYLHKLKEFMLTQYGVRTKYICDKFNRNIEIAAWKEKTLLINNSKIPEYELLITSHVFGHLVQFSNESCPQIVDIINSQKPPINLKNETLMRESYFQFEKGAFEIGLGLIDLAGLDVSFYYPKLNAFMIVDFYFYWKYLISGIKTPLSKIWEEYLSMEIQYQPIDLKKRIPPNSIKLPSREIIVI